MHSNAAQEWVRPGNPTQKNKNGQKDIRLHTDDNKRWKEKERLIIYEAPARLTPSLQMPRDSNEAGVGFRGHMVQYTSMYI